MYLDDHAADRWVFGSCLTNLEIGQSELQQVPDALVSQTSIRSLTLSRNDVEEIPTGPYLAHLTLLDIHDNQSLKFPEALAEALSLQVLWLSGKKPWADVDRLKAILPQHCDIRTAEGQQSVMESRFGVIDSRGGIFD